MSSNSVSNNITKNCVLCKKKVGLTGFTCRCGGYFCGLHRYPEEHQCNFDFRSTHRSLLEKNLLIGKLDIKLERIE